MKKLILFSRMMAPAFIFLMLPTIVLVSCIESPLEPVGPSYNSQLAVPILHRAYHPTNIIKDPANIEYNTDGTFSYVNIYALEKRSLDSITAFPKADSEKTSLGRFRIDTVDIPKTCYATNLFGGYPPPIVPDTTFLTGTEHIVKTYQFIYVRIYKGVLTLTVTNNLPVPINFPSSIVLRNDEVGDNTPLASFNIPGSLAHGDTRQVQDTLDGELVYGHLAIDPFQIHTSGSGGSPVTFSPTDCISFAFQSPPILADSAEAVIPNQSILSDSNSTFTVDDSITIRDARFKKGNLSVEITNCIDLSTEVHVQIQEMINVASGRSFSFDTTFPGPGYRSIPVSIKDYRITTNQTTLGTHLRYFAGITIVNSFGDLKHVSKNDFIQVKITPVDTLYAQSITGNFPTRYVDVYAGTKSDLNFKDTSNVSADSIIFKDIKLKLRLPVSGSETSPPPIDYKNLTLISKNTKLNQIDSITIPDGSIYPTQTDTPVIDFTSAAGFDNFTRSLQHNFPDLPDSFFVRGYIEVNPDFKNHTDARYTIKDSSGVCPLIDINVPSIFKIAGGIICDTQKIEDNLEENIARSVINGTLSLTFTNGIPIQMTSNIGFLKWNDSTKQSQLIKSFNMLGPIAAAHTGADSSAVDSVDSNIRIGLSGDDLRKINNADSVYIQLFMNTRSGTTNGGMVKIRSTDAVMVRASTIVRFTVNKP